MKKIDTIIKNAYLITMNGKREVLPGACIAVEGDKILAVGDSSLLKEYQAGRVIDAAGKYVFPGFISTHSHLFQTMLKGLGRDKFLLDWLNSSVRVALHNYDEETIYYAALNGCIEAIRSGTTTILDFMYAHPIKGLDDCVTQAFEDIGIRGILGRAYSNVSTFPPEIACPMVETEQDFFDDVRRLEKKYRDHSRIGVCMAPGIIWDHTDDGFREMRRTADELHMPITMHLVETPDDDAFSQQMYQEDTIPHLEKLGVLGPDFIAVHCVYMRDEDLETFKKYGVKVSHNPNSNMVLASGVARIPEMLEKGITVSLACDGSASNDTQNMLETIKAASLMQKVYHRDPSLMPASAVVELATLGGAKALGREDSLGSIEPGKKADLVIFDPISPFSNPVHDPVSALVYSSSPSNIHTVLVDGKVVLENGHMTTVDEEKILREAQRLGARLVERSGLGNVQWGQKMPPLHIG
ncbi:amidohydrolase family protein [Pseudoflavonifractor sp. HCP28S3_F10]|uniref:amidohydrolase family protein n=1 Tax=Pseudoflavonifractor sp. HCP28S3_F10 TaxID=3438947 RepID=UPI003F8AE4DB